MEAEDRPTNKEEASPTPAAGTSTPSSRRSSVTGVLPLDVSASLSSASTSFWGFVSSARSTLQVATEAVTRDVAEFKKALAEESADIRHEMEADKATAKGTEPPPATGTGVSSSTTSESTPSESSAAGSESAAAGSHDEWGSRVLDNVERLGDEALNKVIHLLPSALWSFGPSSVNEQPPAAAADGHLSTASGSSANGGGSLASSPTGGHPRAYTPASVSASKLHALESNPASYLTDPTDAAGTGVSREYQAFERHFHADFDAMWADELRTKVLPGLTQTVREMYARYAHGRLEDDQPTPDETPTGRVPVKTFFCRYLYRVRLIQAEEARRTALLGKLATERAANSKEEVDTWASDDDDDEPNVSSESLLPATSPTITTQPLPSPVASSPLPAPAVAPTAAAAADISPSVVASSSAAPPAPAAPAVGVSLSSSDLATPSPAPAAAAAAAAVPVASQSPSPAGPAAASIPARRVPETKEAMRARLEAEAKERVAKKLAEKKAAKEAAAAAAIAPVNGPAPTASNVTIGASTPAAPHPPVSALRPPSPSPSPSLSPSLSSSSVDQVATLSPHYRTDIIAALSSSAAVAGVAASVGVPSHVAPAGAGEPFSALSRGSSHGSGNNSDWETVPPSTTTAPPVAAPTRVLEEPPMAASTAAASEEWDTWE